VLPEPALDPRGHRIGPLSPLVVVVQWAARDTRVAGDVNHNPAVAHRLDDAWLVLRVHRVVALELAMPVRDLVADDPVDVALILREAPERFEHELDEIFRDGVRHRGFRGWRHVLIDDPQVREQRQYGPRTRRRPRGAGD